MKINLDKYNFYTGKSHIILYARLYKDAVKFFKWSILFENIFVKIQRRNAASILGHFATFHRLSNRNLPNTLYFSFYLIVKIYMLDIHTNN